MYACLVSSATLSQFSNSVMGCALRLVQHASACAVIILHARSIALSTTCSSWTRQPFDISCDAFGYALANTLGLTACHCSAMHRWTRQAATLSAPHLHGNHHCLCTVLKCRSLILRAALSKGLCPQPFAGTGTCCCGGAGKR